VKIRIMAVSVAALLLFGMLSFAFGQAAPVDMEKNARNAAQALLNAHQAWGKKLTTPGASIQAKEVEREGSMVKYHLFVSGLPSDALYTVLSWPVTQPQPMRSIEGVSIGKDGIVMCAGRTEEQCGDPSKKDDPIEFAFNPAKGEPLRLALVSGENRAFIVIVPDPIVGKDKGCTLSAVRLLPHFELVSFTGSGFAPNTQVTFDSHSYDERHPLTAQSDANGELHFSLLPFVAGHAKGTTIVKGTGSCSPALTFAWGQ